MQLKNNRLNFSTSTKTPDDMVLIYDRAGRIIYFNHTVPVKLGYNSEELAKMNIIDLYPSWVKEEAEIIISEIFNFKRNDNPLPFKHKDGFIIPVETRVSSGKCDGMDCIFGRSKDFTNEQEALQKFEKLFRMNPTPMAISGITDRFFIDVNNAFLKTLGYAKDEVIGRTSKELAIFEKAEEHDLIAQMLLKNGSISGIEQKIRTKDGRVREGLFSGEIVSSHGKDYFLTVMIDITERKHAENEIKALLAEKQIILKEVHHRIKNFLSTTKGLISLHMDSINIPMARTALKDIQCRLYSMMVLYDKLYLSDNFNELSVADYIPPLVEKIVNNFPKQSMIKTEKKIDNFKLDAKRLQALGIIINELITNIMKYAFTGRDEGVITISATSEGKEVTLSITDDGIGLPESISLENSRGFGMQLVCMLAKQLKGNIMIERLNGTKFILKFKL